MGSTGERPAPWTALGLLALVAAAALTLGACGSDGDGETTSARDTTTTTAGAPSTTTTVSGQPTDPPTYASAIVQAWEAGDRDRALELGTEGAVDALFAEESGGVGLLTFVGCSVHRGNTFCAYEGDRSFGVWVDNDRAAEGRVAVFLVT